MLNFVCVCASFSLFPAETSLNPCLTLSHTNTKRLHTPMGLCRVADCCSKHATYDGRAVGAQLLCCRDMSNPAAGGDLEAQNTYDGSFYDVDTERTQPIVVQSRCGLKIVYK